MRDTKDSAIDSFVAFSEELFRFAGHTMGQRLCTPGQNQICEERQEMRFIQMDFPPTFFLPQNKQNSFYEDAPASEKFKAAGVLLPPVFSEPACKSGEFEKKSV